MGSTDRRVCYDPRVPGGGYSRHIQEAVAWSSDSSYYVRDPYKGIDIHVYRKYIYSMRHKKLSIPS